MMPTLMLPHSSHFLHKYPSIAALQVSQAAVCVWLESSYSYGDWETNKQNAELEDKQ